jgi:hypothetical protein
MINSLFKCHSGKGEMSDDVGIQVNNGINIQYSQKLNHTTITSSEMLLVNRSGTVKRWASSRVTSGPATNLYKSATPVDLWGNTGAIGTAGDHYQQGMPTGILTSQGLV